MKTDFEKQIEEERQEAFHEAMQKVDEIKKQWKIDEYQETITRLKDEKANLEAELKRLEPFKTFKKAFIEAFGVPLGFEPGASVPSEVVVQSEIPSLTVHVVRKPASASAQK